MTYGAKISEINSAYDGPNVLQGTGGLHDFEHKPESRHDERDGCE